ncbi:MAG TPA: PAS domain S-box protein, partial [Holophagaceae bacterium]|nr:PAS domain S-box protein [Holophagaceae bacterium]
MGVAFLLTLRSMDRTRLLSVQRLSAAQALTALTQGLSDLKDAETGQRGYLLTGDPAYLGPYDRGRAQASETLGAFSKLEGARELAPEDLARLQNLCGAKLDELDRTIRLAKAGKRDEALAIVKAGDGLRVMDAIRETQASFASNLERRKAEADHALMEERQRLRWTLFLLGGLAFLTLGGGAWALYRGDRLQLRAEQSLAAADSKLRQMVNGIRDYAILMLDPEGRIIGWNKGAEEIKGYEASEILGEHFSRFYLPEDRAANHPARMLEEAKETGRVEEEGWRLRKDGSKFWADTVITALREASGRLLGFVKVTRDLTERRRVEEELRASERRFRTLAEAAPVGIYEYDFERDAIYANSAHCRLAGVPKEEATRERLRAAVHPEDRPRVLARVEADMGGGTPFDQI